MILTHALKEMINFDSLKIFGFNGLAFLSTLTNIDIVLKRVLVAATIIYTIVKVIAVVKNELRKTKENKANK